MDRIRILFRDQKRWGSFRIRFTFVEWYSIHPMNSCILPQYFALFLFFFLLSSFIVSCVFYIFSLLVPVTWSYSLCVRYWYCILYKVTFFLLFIFFFPFLFNPLTIPVLLSPPTVLVPSHTLSLPNCVLKGTVQRDFRPPVF